MLIFHLESWSAIAPGLESQDDWKQWLQNPVAIDQPLGKMNLAAIPALLRRRFNTLGKCAMAATMPLVQEIENIPSIFASRHGDTDLSFSLLHDIGVEQPTSPTSFSLAVHNAIAGLFSIARKDTSAITAIAAMQGLVLQTFFEAIGQLQDNPRVLCVIYDIPLPEFYRQCYSDEELPFPYAIALVLNRAEGQAYQLEHGKPVASDESGLGEHESMRLLGLLSGLRKQTELRQKDSTWRISRIED